MGYSVWCNKEHKKTTKKTEEKLIKCVMDLEGYIEKQTEISLEKAKRDLDEYVKKQSERLIIKAKMECEGESILEWVDREVVPPNEWVEGED